MSFQRRHYYTCTTSSSPRWRRVEKCTRVTMVTKVDTNQDPLLNEHMPWWEFVYSSLKILRTETRVCAFEEEKWLKSSLLGISDGSPDIKDKLVRESKVSKGLIKSHCEFIWVLFITTDFNHRSSWKGTSNIFLVNNMLNCCHQNIHKQWKNWYT